MGPRTYPACEISQASSKNFKKELHSARDDGRRQELIKEKPEQGIIMPSSLNRFSQADFAEGDKTKTENSDNYHQQDHFVSKTQNKSATTRLSL